MALIIADIRKSIISPPVDYIAPIGVFDLFLFRLRQYSTANIALPTYAIDLLILMMSLSRFLPQRESARTTIDIEGFLLRDTKKLEHLFL